MFEKFKEMADRFDEIDRMMTDPAIAGDPKKCSALMKERARISKWAARYREYEETVRRSGEAKQMLKDEKDPELRAMAEDELKTLSEVEAKARGEMEEMLLSSDDNSARSVIIEV